MLQSHRLSLLLAFLAAFLASAQARTLQVADTLPTDTTSLTFHSVNEALLYAQRHPLADTTWTDILIAPGVYWIDDPTTPAVKRPARPGEPPYGLEVNVQRTRLIGQGASPEDVVLASQRGQTQGADGNFTMLHLIGDDFHAENLTFGNYCNVDLVYPLRPELNRAKRHDAIVQAQLIISQGDRYTARRCRFISRLNLCPFAGARHATFDDCYMECTDDALCGTGLYRHCRFTFYSSKPFYATSTEGATFIDCDIHTLVRGTQYLTKVSSPVTLRNCRWTSDDPNLRIAWTPKPNPKHHCEMTGCTLNGQPYDLAPTPDVPMPVAPICLPVGGQTFTELRPGQWTTDAYKPLDTQAYQWSPAPSADDPQPSWAFAEGEDGAEGCFGLMPIRRGARLRYTGREGETYAGQTLTLSLNPCKQAGQGFGSATGQYFDVCLKFDTHTLSGYGIRFIRTPDYGNAVEVYLVAYQDGVVSPLTEPQRCDVFRRGCQLSLTFTQGRLTARVSNPSQQPDKPGNELTVDGLTLNPFGGIHLQHTGTLGASSLVIDHLKSSYLDK